ncbi:hypothetical protein [Methanoculleus sp.]|uniref:hypothetical protein n=1 Tax=Methanoculleus sp. TaxID=90427 RepID=UPI0025E9409F|nr:hypothetical protein [Methanoculleus sp.]MCK9319234.1 hypothetical protein [Methanoculleus sp.]MDD2255039.1 hypothetical protein [Methanoculleus sp.]MDD2788489.1 hypothetical protein [Methanoculleus sp.]MDD3217420.1 hypothetical protein [Methanoculleus sp.]MDD4315242.1 hypothetical protein [Methanoculleus sp.]
MDLLSELNRNLDYSERLKDELTIGLFGSFRRSHLEALKRHLREHEGFNTRVSYDLAASHPRRRGKDDGAYDFRLARALIEESRVDIIHFFREEEGEYGVNDSATLEIGILYGLNVASPQASRYTLILCEAGYDARNIGGMRRGIRPSTEKEWRWHDFEDRDEAILNATQFCYDCLLDYSRSPRVI